MKDAIKDRTVYFVAPPCQPWSPAGKQKGNLDPRADLYNQTIDRIIAAQPLIAFVENSSALATDEKGKTLRDIKHKLTQGGYQVQHATINTLSHGLPQYRNRLWIIAFRNNHEFHNEWEWPEPLPTPVLADVLLPIANDPPKPERRPKSQAATKQIDQAQARATKENTQGDWAVAEHLSASFLKNPRPRAEAPALTFSKTQGHWLGSRGRRITTPESARLQGFPYHQITWPGNCKHSHQLLGNTMSINVTQRLIIAAPHRMNIFIPDPWVDGSAMKTFKQDVKQDLPNVGSLYREQTGLITIFQH